MLAINVSIFRTDSESWKAASFREYRRRVAGACRESFEVLMKGNTAPLALTPIISVKKLAPAAGVIRGGRVVVGAGQAAFL